MTVTTGRPNFSAIFIRRSALRYPSGWGMPKLRRRFSFMARPFCWPMTMTDRPSRHAHPATMAWSSR